MISENLSAFVFWVGITVSVMSFGIGLYFTHVFPRRYGREVPVQWRAVFYMMAFGLAFLSNPLFITDIGQVLILATLGFVFIGLAIVTTAMWVQQEFSR